MGRDEFIKGFLVDIIFLQGLFSLSTVAREALYFFLVQAEWMEISEMVLVHRNQLQSWQLDQKIPLTIEGNYDMTQ